MPLLKRPDAEIYYEVHRSGFPLPLCVPGGPRSQVGLWEKRDAWDAANKGNGVRDLLVRNAPK
ncbi:hypothetical protein [Reyranella sp.]|uniref:hypothetical protein n=1 Tax=Reyranella sp. TaxID=1929291 RepID=UPI0037835B8D